MPGSVRGAKQTRAVLGLNNAAGVANWNALLVAVIADVRANNLPFYVTAFNQQEWNGLVGRIRGHALLAPPSIGPAAPGEPANRMEAVHELCVIALDRHRRNTVPPPLVPAGRALAARGPLVPPLPGGGVLPVPGAPAAAQRRSDTIPLAIVNFDWTPYSRPQHPFYDTSLWVATGRIPLRLKIIDSAIDRIPAMGVVPGPVAAPAYEWSAPYVHTSLPLAFTYAALRAECANHIPAGRAIWALYGALKETSPLVLGRPDEVAVLHSNNTITRWLLTTTAERPLIVQVVLARTAAQYYLSTINNAKPEF